MAIELRRMQPGDELEFSEIAPDVFDEPIHPGRLEAYLRRPGHLLILVNPPFTLEGELRVLLPALAQLLGDPGQGRHKLEWIRGEAPAAAPDPGATRARTGSTGSPRPRRA